LFVSYFKIAIDQKRPKETGGEKRGNIMKQIEAWRVTEKENWTKFPFTYFNFHDRTETVCVEKHRQKLIAEGMETSMAILRRI